MIDHQRGVSVRSDNDVFSDLKNSESKDFYGERTVSSNGKWHHRSGYASLDDLEPTDWKDIFTELENIQSDFLSREGKFRSPEYKWPHDPLHCVARPWEYAYVFSNLKDWQESHPEIDQLKVMDFGSGVTFFPFAFLT